jgi:hypothetical protein
MLGSQSWNDMSCVYVLRKLISRCPLARARERERERGGKSDSVVPVFL